LRFERVLKGVGVGVMARWILAGLVGLFGVAVFVLAVRDGRADSALLFIGLPVLMSIALVLMPGRTTHGRVFSVTTVGLLLAAVALHEGAICVALAAPIVYAVAHGATALLNGPGPAAVRSVPLRMLGVPLPERVEGSGLAAGDRWMFHYPGSAHGSGGHTVTEVVAAAPGLVEFRVVEDSAITARWLVWRSATVRWKAVGERTEVRLSIVYTRRLDPSWYFGPIQQVLMREGAGYLLDTMMPQ
jgi:hypothetical protein